MIPAIMGSRLTTSVEMIKILIGKTSYSTFFYISQLLLARRKIVNTFLSVFGTFLYFAEIDLYISNNLIVASLES